MISPQFETDLSPDEHWPRVRFNFANGWSASLVIRTGKNGMDAIMAMVAACPIGRWQDGITEMGLGWNELSAGEAIAILAEIAMRPAREAQE